MPKYATTVIGTSMNSIQSTVDTAVIFTQVWLRIKMTTSFLQLKYFRHSHTQNTNTHTKKREGSKYTSKN